MWADREESLGYSCSGENLRGLAGALSNLKKR